MNQRKHVAKFHEVTEQVWRNRDKAKEKKMQTPGLKINLNFADFEKCAGPQTPEEFRATKFLVSGSKTMLEYAKACGVNLDSAYEATETISDAARKDNPELRQSLRGKDLPELRAYCSEQGWTEEEYATIKNAALLLEKIIQRSLESEVLK